MKGIVELKYNVFLDELEIRKSISIIDKNKDHYEAKFQYQNGYVSTESFIRKKEMGVPQRYYCNIHRFVMYVSKVKYENSPEEFQKIIKGFNV